MQHNVFRVWCRPDPSGCTIHDVCAQHEHEHTSRFAGLLKNFKYANLFDKSILASVLFFPEGANPLQAGWTLCQRSKCRDISLLVSCKVVSREGYTLNRNEVKLTTRGSNEAGLSRFRITKIWISKSKLFFIGSTDEQNLAKQSHDRRE